MAAHCEVVAMATGALPKVDCDQIHAGLAVTNIKEAVEFYSKRLGFTTGFLWGDPPRFAGMNLGNVQMFLREGTPEPKGCFVTFVVGNADELYEFHRAQGVDIAEPIADRDYGIRDYSVRDLHGHYLSFGHHLYGVGEPIKIERIDLPVRLEKRLAGLLEDLAKRKHMSLGSCLEEMILHTNDGVGPHTKGDLRYIGELKKKHGIDYDTHASYRFSEE
jgi:catechol 2,3-dioxygenase-like lactoylglutathione lyase family enzyme